MSASAEIISVGTELLLGEIANEDARLISERLAEAGIDVFHHSVTGDNPSRLSDALRTALSRSEIIIFTGGLGPTCDDLTKKTIADYLGLKMSLNEHVRDGIKEYFKKIRKEMTPNNDLQALIPEGAEILTNDWGTAPGILIRHEGKMIFMLPGPPDECSKMTEFRLLPALKEKSGGTIKSRFIRLFGIGESEAESKLIDMMNDHANPTVAPYAKFGEVLIRVTAKAPSGKEALEMTEPAVMEIRRRLGRFIYAIDSGSMEEGLVSLLRNKKMTVSCAESCTGGMLSERITSVPGASEVFPGGIVSYSEDIKSGVLGADINVIRKYGVVSKETAESMAAACRKLFNTDIGIGITGYAGPSAPSEEELGHVFVSVITDKKAITRDLHLGNKRDRVRKTASMHAMKAAIELSIAD